MPSLHLRPEQMSRPVAKAARARTVMDDVTFCAWVAQAAPGDELIYHRGFLGVDTGRGISTLPEAERRKLSDLASAAYRAFQSGVVHLVQARLDIDHFAYIAIARPRPEAAAASLSRMLLAEAA